MAWRDGGRLERHRAGSALDPTPHTAGASSVPRTGTCWWPVSHPCRAKLGGDLSFTQLLLFLLSCTQHCHSSCHTMAHASGVQQHQSTSSSQHILYIFLCLLLDAAAARTGCALRCQPGWFAPLGHFSGSPSQCAGGREGAQRTSSNSETPLSTCLDNLAPASRKRCFWGVQSLQAGAGNHRGWKRPPRSSTPPFS